MQIAWIVLDCAPAVFIHFTLPWLFLSYAAVYSGVKLSADSIECRAPPSSLGRQEVTISSNGVDFYGGIELTYATGHLVTGITPLQGDINGGTEVFVSGTGFNIPAVPKAELRHETFHCRFNEEDVPAVVLKRSFRR